MDGRVGLNDQPAVEQVGATAFCEHRWYVAIVHVAESGHRLTGRGLDRPELNRGVLFLEITPRADQSSAGAEARDQMRELGSVAPDLRPGPRVVRGRVCRVGVLIGEDPLRVLQRELLSSSDGTVGSFVARSG